MDIIVTTPKSEIDNSKLEGSIVEQEEGYWFRTFRFRPKVEIGDKIFFVESGQIKGHGIILRVSPTCTEKCDVTGRVWKGDWVVKYNDWHWLTKPIPFKSFQGIRYLDRLPQLKEQLLNNRNILISVSIDYQSRYNMRTKYWITSYDLLIRGRIKPEIVTVYTIQKKWLWLFTSPVRTTSSGKIIHFKTKTEANEYVQELIKLEER